MSNLTVTVLAWLAVGTHLVVAVLAWRRPELRSLLPIVNVIVALGVLAYWVQRWYDYLVNGTTWYAADQAVPLYAIGVCVLAALALTGRYRGAVPNALVFGLDGLVMLAAALFFSFVRFNRLF